MQTFYLIDGTAFFYRAYYAIRDLSTASGIPTNAVYGITQMLLKLVEDERPDYLAIALDPKGPTFRHALYAEYKIHRPSMPDPLVTQIPYLHRMIEALQIQMLMVTGYEADDLIGTVAKKAESAGLSVVIVSGDKDMIQLISPGITLYDTTKKKRSNEQTVLDQYGITPSQFVELIGLMGDAADHIPGVKGVGEKTALELVRTYGTIEHLFMQLDQIQRPKLREMLSLQQEQARLSRRLAVIDTACPFDFHLEDFVRKSPDPQQLIPLCRELEFVKMVERFGVRVEESPPSVCLETEQVGIDHFLLKMRENRLVAIEPVFSMGTPLARSCIGFALAVVAPPVGIFLKTSDSKTILKEVFESSEITKVGHDIKPLLGFLQKEGIACRGTIFDTMIAAHLLNPDQRNHSLEALATEYLKELIEAVPPPLAGQSGESASYFCGRAGTVLKLTEVLRPRLAAQSLDTPFSEIEMPLVPILANMEQAGMKIDVALLGAMSLELHSLISESTRKIYQMAGTEFNIQSPKQLAEILFDRLGLKPVRKTKTGYSTDEEALTFLGRQHPLPAEIIQIRQWNKLKSTYVDPLPTFVDRETGRVHTQFHQAATATGRLSSTDPNLQNIPVRGVMGQKIREAFVAESGHLLLSADYNQIELRLLAHLSEDSVMISSLCNGEDLHLQTATHIFGLPKTEISSEMRRVAKTVNFGIIYGISPFGLSASLGISKIEANRYIDLYFERYSGVKRFIEQMQRQAKEQGEVTTLFHRRRQVGNRTGRADHGMDNRIAVNTPIQGTAADIIKLAMIKIVKWMGDEAMQSKMILQIHDELLFEVAQSECDRMVNQVTSLMEGVVALKVPLKIKISVGQNWGQVA